MGGGGADSSSEVEMQLNLDLSLLYYYITCYICDYISFFKMSMAWTSPSESEPRLHAIFFKKNQRIISILMIFCAQSLSIVLFRCIDRQTSAVDQFILTFLALQTWNLWTTAQTSFHQLLASYTSAINCYLPFHTLFTLIPPRTAFTTFQSLTTVDTCIITEVKSLETLLASCIVLAGLAIRK